MNVWDEAKELNVFLWTTVTHVLPVRTQAEIGSGEQQAWSRRGKAKLAGIMKLCQKRGSAPDTSVISLPAKFEEVGFICWISKWAKTQTCSTPEVLFTYLSASWKSQCFSVPPIPHVQITPQILSAETAQWKKLQDQNSRYRQPLYQI